MHAPLGGVSHALSTLSPVLWVSWSVLYPDSPFFLTQSCSNSDPAGALTGQTVATYFLKSSGRQVVAKEENNLLRSVNSLRRNGN